MKKIILAALVLIRVNSFAQKYDDKIKIAKDKAFQEMVLNAAYASAKSIVADNTANSSVKKFSQIILTTITQPDARIIEGLGFYLLSIPEVAVINEHSPQSDIDFAMPFVFSLFAKAWYGDVSVTAQTKQ